MDDSFVLFPWPLFLLLIVGGMELASLHSVHHLGHVYESYSLSLPSRIEVSGRVMGPHLSNGSLVFDLENEGKMTCYYRHPSPVLSVFSGDEYVVRGRLEWTPKGRLCVVEELIPHVLG